MIHWLLQSLDDCPEILRGDATPGWLGAAERERLAGFKVEKRRRDWLLGRWTAKHLVQRYLAELTGAAPALDAIFIDADADGAPYASCQLPGARGEERLPVSLSISHSHGTAFCGVVEAFSTQRRKDAETQENRLLPLVSRPSLGCDIEFIEPREPNFVRSYFAAEEMAAVAASGQNQDVLVTAIWSGKEAVLKALREGLRIDTRRITCRFDGFTVAPQEWTPFFVAMDGALADQFPGIWSGWWRVKDRFVLTMALLGLSKRTTETQPV